MHCMPSKPDDDEDPLIKLSISLSVIKSAFPTLIVKSTASNLKPQRAIVESALSLAWVQLSLANPFSRQRDMSSTLSRSDLEHVQEDSFVGGVDETLGFLPPLEKARPPTLFVFEFMIIIIICNKIDF